MPKQLERISIAADKAADKFIQALIDRVISTERQLAALRKTVDDNFESYAESLPHLMPDGKIRFRGVLRDNCDAVESFTVDVTPTLCEEE